MHNAEFAGKMLQEKYPDKKIVVIDTLCSSSGYGLLVDTAADMRDAGASLDEVANWVMRNRNKVHHQFFSSDMTQFHRTGRVSGATAMVASIMNICPIMRLDSKGAIKAYGKVRGKKKAVQATVDAMVQHAQGGRGLRPDAASSATPSARRMPQLLIGRRSRSASRTLQRQDPPVRHRHDHRLAQRPRHRRRVLLRR